MNQCEITIRSKDLTLRCLKEKDHDHDCRFASDLDNDKRFNRN
jgi:hypothetical protein